MQAGILEPRAGVPDLTQVILADQTISEEHKQALVRIYLSFRRERESSDDAVESANADPVSAVTA